jgi:hypothetical protein
MLIKVIQIWKKLINTHRYLLNYFGTIKSDYAFYPYNERVSAKFS